MAAGPRRRGVRRGARRLIRDDLRGRREGARPAHPTTDGPTCDDRSGARGARPDPGARATGLDARGLRHGAPRGSPAGARRHGGHVDPCCPSCSAWTPTAAWRCCSAWPRWSTPATLNRPVFSGGDFVWRSTPPWRCSPAGRGGAPRPRRAGCARSGRGAGGGRTSGPIRGWRSSVASRLRQGPRRRTTSVLRRPMIVLCEGVVGRVPPTRAGREGSIPASARRSVYRMARCLRPAIRVCDESRPLRGPALMDGLPRGRPPRSRRWRCG